MKRSRLTFEGRILLLALMAGLPGSLVALVMLWVWEHPAKVQWTLTVFIVCLWLGFAFAVREKVVYPLQTLSNLLAALREGDFSVRGRGNSRDALGEVISEVNTLSSTLREQRLGAQEATRLLATVLHEIDVAVFAFDEEQKLRLANRAGERLLGAPEPRLSGQTAAELKLERFLEGDPEQTVTMAFPGGIGRWGIRRTSVRERGRPLQLLVVQDLTRPLREEELQAWQRMVRVLGHELNNSLTPIKSIAGSLESILARGELPADWRDDMRRGLAVIASRSDALGRFTGAYARLAKLPRPQVEPLEIGPLVERAARMETRVPVRVESGPPLRIHADPDQIEQVLINLLRNAADASLETGGGVSAGWRRNGAGVAVWIRDEGPGLANTANLFVPFFTTKPAGSGIGLVLCRQIAEAHGGGLSLENREDGKGCVAWLKLPG